MEKLGVALLVLLLAVFIGNILYKETFADCNSPGQMTWTITLNPDSTCSPGSGESSGSSGSSSSGGYAKQFKDASGNGLLADSVKGLTSGSSSESSGSKDTANTNSSLINLSLTDLLALIGSAKDNSGNRIPPAYNYRYASMSIPQPPAPPAPPAPQVYIMPGPMTRSIDSQFPTDLRTSRMDPVLGRYAEGNTLGGTATVLEDERIPIGSYSTQQGVQYIKGTPSNNPVAEQPLLSENSEYIRKDSIPCYACSL